MAAITNTLSELHKLHLQYQDVKDKLVRGPKQIEARKRFVNTKKQEAETIHTQYQKLKMDADSRGLQLKTNEARIENLKLKLNTAASNKEFNIIKGQIEADEVANSVLEDEILEVLEKVDATSAKVHSAQEAVESAEQETQRIAQEISQAEPGLKSEAEKLTAAIREAERQLPPTVGEQYRRLVQAHGAGAMASVSNSVCSNCHVTITPQMLVQLNIGHVIFCKTCGRMLYSEEA